MAKLTDTGAPERVRGSANVPLNEEGRQQAQDLAQRVGASGGADVVYTGPSDRHVNTGHMIAKASGLKGVIATKDLGPWRLGSLEGQPVDKVRPMMDHYASMHPYDKVPGRSPDSTEDGESFNDFLQRFLPFADKQAKLWSPNEKIMNVTSYRNIHALMSWLKNGAPESHDIDMDHMLSKGTTKPGDLMKLNPEELSLDKVKDTSSGPGIYWARHGSTQYNSSMDSKGS